MSDVPLDDLPASVLVDMVRALPAQVAALQAERASLRSGDPPPRKTAAHSSLPPGNGCKARRPDPPPGTAPPKRGPKPGHPGVSRLRVPADQVQVRPCRPPTWGHCGAGLAPDGGVVVARRQLTELPPVPPVVVEAQRWRVRCRRCGHGTVGA
jgi:hypothetical protein